MSQEKNTIKNRKFKQLNMRQRIRIEILLKEGYTALEISSCLKVSKRTINREIKRGMVYGLRNSDETTRDEYSADKANKDAEIKASKKGPRFKIGKCIELSDYLEKEIKERKKSPYAALKTISKDNLIFNTSICEKTLYNYIHMGMFFELTSKDLPYKRKGKKKGRIANNNRSGTSLEERSPIVELREEYGHWEIDCVVGKRAGKGAVLLTLVERKTRMIIVRKLKSKTQVSVIMELKKLEKEFGKTKFKKIFKSITADNGVEFLDQENMEKSGFKSGMKTKIYYCHAYCSWERGSNENANKLVRRWIPKGERIENNSKKRIKEIETWINNYPRKLFNGLSSVELEMSL